jgi:hypothetical protein
VKVLTDKAGDSLDKEIAALLAGDDLVKRGTA